MACTAGRGRLCRRCDGTAKDSDCTIFSRRVETCDDENCNTPIALAFIAATIPARFILIFAFFTHGR